ncbi:hypothetical protein GGTG_02190 [Gaeumannomyces tritici R3-111a-1]|uniref:Uncharacterized protein n=1 Tax=Gaeumannomyces tritici (strain R3-111a-1) TaxID=644352 RepID=J3NLP0_GAET3|nr:hypothetical protein GGTG_02190 [Gaeumannomyces tritici R3-111a-1]EJT82216.1 hypothetical protein GGTG_02190 [Gaeumannomyces tritici R3-111a-1]
MASTGRYNHQAKARQAGWQEGDIAFLRSHHSFTEDEYKSLIGKGPGRLAIGATCHPVIILRRCPRQGLSVITTVSAYASEERRNLPPWRQVAHGRKRPQDFRAFAGSELPPSPAGAGAGSGRPALTLAAPHMRMPKPRASWVYVRHVAVVPDSVLGVFNKSPVHLRVSRASVGDLLAHMRESCPAAIGWCLSAVVGAAGSGRAPVASLDTSTRVAPAADIPAAEYTKARDAASWRGPTSSVVAARPRAASSSSSSSTTSSSSSSAVSSISTAPTDPETEEHTGSEVPSPAAAPLKAAWSAIVKAPSKASATITHLTAAVIPAATITLPASSWASIAGSQARSQPGPQEAKKVARVLRITF